MDKEREFMYEMFYALTRAVLNLMVQVKALKSADTELSETVEEEFDDLYARLVVVERSLAKIIMKIRR